LAKNIFARVDEVATGANHGALSEFACINEICLWLEIAAYPQRPVCLLGHSCL
jgi:hypothetical protein